jgi:hypothetical protein
MQGVLGDSWCNAPCAAARLLRPNFCLLRPKFDSTTNVTQEAVKSEMVQKRRFEAQRLVSGPHFEADMERAQLQRPCIRTDMSGAGFHAEVGRLFFARKRGAPMRGLRLVDCWRLGLLPTHSIC